MKAKSGFSVVPWMMLLAVWSCAGAPVTNAKAPSSEAPEPEPSAQAQSVQAVSGYSTEESNECIDRPCSANLECCTGYACGFDPDRSRVQRYCMAE